MNRLYKLELELNKFIDEQVGKVDNRDETLEWEKIHMISSGRIGWMLALQRNVEPEIAACAAAIHDFGRIITGRQKSHAEDGFVPVKTFLRDLDMFSEDEISTIALSVKNHSLKTEVGSAVEEIVKDADVIDCYQYGCPFDRPEKEVRYKNWLKEISQL